MSKFTIFLLGLCLMGGYQQLLANDCPNLSGIFQCSKEDLKKYYDYDTDDLETDKTKVEIKQHGFTFTINSYDKRNEVFTANGVPVKTFVTEPIGVFQHRTYCRDHKLVIEQSINGGVFCTENMSVVESGGLTYLVREWSVNNFDNNKEVDYKISCKLVKVRSNL